MEFIFEDAEVNEAEERGLIQVSIGPFKDIIQNFFFPFSKG